jgi:hypothetical protein
VSGEPVQIVFLEPKIVITKASNCLDIDIEGQEFNVNLPIGIKTKLYVIYLKLHILHVTGRCLFIQERYITQDLLRNS